jgi:hypothetical protein
MVVVSRVSTPIMAGLQMKEFVFAPITAVPYVNEDLCLHQSQLFCWGTRGSVPTDLGGNGFRTTGICNHRKSCVSCLLG